MKVSLTGLTRDRPIDPLTWKGCVCVVLGIAMLVFAAMIPFPLSCGSMFFGIGFAMKGISIIKQYSKRTASERPEKVHILTIAKDAALKAKEGRI